MGISVKVIMYVQNNVLGNVYLIVNLEDSSTDTPGHWDSPFGRMKFGLGYSISVRIAETGVEQEDPFLKSESESNSKQKQKSKSKSRSKLK